MNILITGSNGFIGKNLSVALKRLEGVNVFEYDLDSPPGLLAEGLARADVIFHLAGVNRPERMEAFQEVNADLTKTVCEELKRLDRKPLIVLASSTQALLDNPYGVSKRQAEEAVVAFGQETGAPVSIFRLPGVFGKWCRPNYNSVVATFCNNIARDLPISISDPSNEVSLVYIDDVVDAFISEIRGQRSEITEPRTGNRGQRSEDRLLTSDLRPPTSGKKGVEPIYRITLGELAERINSFKSNRETNSIPNLSDSFVKKLHSTYLSFLPNDNFSYPLKMNIDNRGSFTEFIKSDTSGQVSINVSKSGVTKGNHWHRSKNEKFLVVSGKGSIKFRKIDNEEVIEYLVNGDRLEVVDIPPGYTHKITNTGQTDLVTVMWVNEPFDPENSDTFFELVESSKSR